jgi:hypothetical protein
MKYDDRKRTRQRFTLTEREHRGARAGNERLVCRVTGERGLLTIWATTGIDMRHIDALESEHGVSRIEATTWSLAARYSSLIAARR